MKQRRRLLRLLLGVIGVANLIRAGLALYVRPTLADWPLALPLTLLAGLYAAWGLTLTLAAWAARTPRGRRWALPLAVGYQVTMWALQLWGSRTAYARSLWPRNALFSALFLGAVAYLAHASQATTAKSAANHSESQTEVDS